MVGRIKLQTSEGLFVSVVCQRRERNPIVGMKSTGTIQYSFRAKENKTLRDPDRWSTATSASHSNLCSIFIVTEGQHTMACTVAAFSPVRKVLLPLVMLLSLCRPTTSFQYTLTSVSRKIQQRAQTTNSGKTYRWWPLASSSSSSSSSSQETDSLNILPSSLASRRAEDSPWTDPQLRERRLELMERSSLNARQRNKHNR
jgi:hypothetical protein